MAERKISTSSPVIGALAHLTVAAGARLPLPLAQSLGAALGAVGWLLPTGFRKVSRLNVDWCFPGLPRRQRRRLARQSLLATGRWAGEAGAMLRWPARRLSALVDRVDGGEILERAMSGASGAVILLPHLGNWELMNQFLSARYPFVALYRPSRIVEVDRLLRLRERTGCELLPTSTSGLRRLYRAVGEGRPVVILPDQEPVRRAGVFADFFGIPALTMTLVARLMRRLEAPAVFGYALRGSPGRFRIVFREAPPGLDHPDPVAAAERLNEGVEACVRDCPEQYMWSYQRFKTRPPDEEHALRVLGDPSRVRLYKKRKGVPRRRSSSPPT